jgi:hypothetical protein
MGPDPFKLNNNICILINLIITRMKKLFLFLGLFLLFTTQLVAQSRTDQALILQKCIDLPELQSYLKDSEGKIQQLCINYWNPLLFPLNLGLTKGGKSIIYKPMYVDSDKAGVPFILFRTFLITGEVAKVDFEYHFVTNNSSQLLKVHLDFIKNDNDWEISKTALTNQ